MRRSLKRPTRSRMLHQAVQSSSYSFRGRTHSTKLASSNTRAHLLHVPRSHNGDCYAAVPSHKQSSYIATHAYIRLTVEKHQYCDVAPIPSLMHPSPSDAHAHFTAVEATSKGGYPAAESAAPPGSDHRQTLADLRAWESSELTMPPRSTPPPAAGSGARFAKPIQMRWRIAALKTRYKSSSEISLCLRIE